MKPFRPMLAATVEESDLDNLTYPVVVQPKLDGIRCIILNGFAVSRTLKPIPNHAIRNGLEFIQGNFYRDLDVIDGELVSGKNFQDTTSAVMTHDGRTDYHYLVFDCFLKSPYETFAVRFNPVIQKELSEKFTIVETLIATDKDHLLRLEHDFVVIRKCEGIIIRSFRGKYKYGRSTLNEQYLLKLKRFIDSEAKIIGFEEEMTNANPQTLNALGYSERSSSQSRQVPADTLGAIQVKDIHDGREFNIGSGFTDNQRKEIWTNRVEFIHKIVKYKYQKYGEKDLPRSPTFLGFRKD